MFVFDLQDVNKKLVFSSFVCLSYTYCIPSPVCIYIFRIFPTGMYMSKVQKFGIFLNPVPDPQHFLQQCPLCR